MRININLASQKYEEVRQFYVRWGWAIAGTAALTILLLVLAVWNYSDSAQSNRRIKDLEQKIASLEQERTAAQAFINRPENHDVTAQKNYWNIQFAKRSFSWTQLFNDLQRIMPNRAYVNSVHPEVTPDRRVKLALVIIGDNHQNALELVKKMENSEHFRGPHISDETIQKEARSGVLQYKFTISTYYTPTSPAQPRAATKESM